MHVLNGLHIATAFLLAGIVLVVGLGLAAIVEVLATRRYGRAHIEPCEYETSEYHDD